MPDDSNSVNFGAGASAMAPDASTSPLGHTPGPLHIQQDSEWPYTIRICTQTGEVIHSEPLACSSSHWKGLDDARNLLGIYGFERQVWQHTMDRQMADMRLRAAAPELLEALEGTAGELAELYRALADTKADAQRRIEGEPCLIAARAAIAKARGEQA